MKPRFLPVMELQWGLVPILAEVYGSPLLSAAYTVSNCPLVERVLLGQLVSFITKDICILGSFACDVIAASPGFEGITGCHGPMGRFVEVNIVP